MLIPRFLDIGPGQVRQNLLLTVLTTNEAAVGLKILQKGVARKRHPKATFPLSSPLLDTYRRKLISFFCLRLHAMLLASFAQKSSCMKLTLAMIIDDV